MHGGFWWEGAQGTCGGVELVPWGLRFASVRRGSGELEGQSRGETRCITNLDKSSTEGGTRWITQKKVVLFTNFLFVFLFHIIAAFYTQRTGLSEGPKYRITNAWRGFVPLHGDFFLHSLIAACQP